MAKKPRLKTILPKRQIPQSSRVTPTLPNEVMIALIQFRKDNFLKSENMVASMAIVVFLKKHGYLKKDFPEPSIVQ